MFFPFGTHIFALKEDNSKLIRRNILHKHLSWILCILLLCVPVDCLDDLLHGVHADRLERLSYTAVRADKHPGYPSSKAPW